MNRLPILTLVGKMAMTVGFIFLTKLSNGQNTVTPAVNSDVSLNLASSSAEGQTANDIWETDNCVKFKAAVNEYGISWSFVDGCNSISDISSTAFAHEVISPDVAIVKHVETDYPFTETYYALVVYYDPTDDNYYLQPWLFDVNATPFPTLVPFAGTGSIYPQVLDNSAPNPLYNGIRIDANMIGEFVIVLDNVETHELKAGAGHFDGTSGEPVLSVTGMTMFQIEQGNHWTPYQPDVAIQQSREADAAEVYITFLGDDSFGNPFVHIHVISETYLDIWNGTMSSPLSMNILAKESCTLYQDFYERPRIAASGDVETNLDWTVVWRFYDGSANESHILGLSSPDLETPHFHNYTDNSEIIPSELGYVMSANIYNRNPSVSYGFDEVEGTIAQIAWQGGWPEPIDPNTLPNTGAPNNGSGGETAISIIISRGGDFIG